MGLWAKSMEAKNIHLLTEVGRDIDGVGLPWLLAGDFNMGPKALQLSGIPRKAGLVVLAPKSATCITARSRSVTDFFTMAPSIVRMTKAVETIPCEVVAVHEPVQVSLSSGDDEARYLQLITPAYLPAHSSSQPRIATRSRA